MKLAVGILIGVAALAALIYAGIYAADKSAYLPFDEE